MTRNQVDAIRNQESERHNKEAERQAHREHEEKVRSNYAQETETHRSNVTKEGQNERDLQLKQDKVSVDKANAAANFVKALNPLKLLS